MHTDWFSSVEIKLKESVMVYLWILKQVVQTRDAADRTI